MGPHLQSTETGLGLAVGTVYCKDETTWYREGKLKQAKTSQISQPLIKQNYKCRHKNSQ